MLVERTCENCNSFKHATAHFCAECGEVMPPPQMTTTESTVKSAANRNHDSNPDSIHATKREAGQRFCTFCRKKL